MKRIMISLTLLAFATALIVFSNSAVSSEHVNEKYQCPMKCEGEKMYDNPGKCPVCGMTLKIIDEPVSNKIQGADYSVKVIGAMMNVMHQGELFGRINLDTISSKKHLFGLGPIEYLKGEVLIKDGKCFVSRVSSNGEITVENNFKVRAPFFVYGNVDKWDETALPDSVQSLTQLNSFLEQATGNHSRPFAFRLTADIDSCEIHIVNLPNGKEVHSPQEAHEGQKSYSLQNERAELVGFFSTEHQMVFTHHDTFVHIHLISSDGKKMGHLDNLMIKKGTAKLYLPAE